jgi:hypothetical protein
MSSLAQLLLASRTPITTKQPAAALHRRVPADTALHVVAAPASTSVAPEAGAGTAPDGTAPVDFQPPPGAQPCVPPGSLVKLQGLIGVDPPSSGFGDVDPKTLGGNFASLQLTNSGTAPQTVSAISCTPLDTVDPSVSTFFVLQFGPGGQTSPVSGTCRMPFYPCAACMPSSSAPALLLCAYAA